jgi:hypothetical protein
MRAGLVAVCGLVVCGLALAGCSGGAAGGASGAQTTSGPAATPVFSVAAGTYPAPQTVTITDASAGATIYYSTDGSTPSVMSTLYSGPVHVASSETLQAVAIGRAIAAAR